MLFLFLIVLYLCWIVLFLLGFYVDLCHFFVFGDVFCNESCLFLGFMMFLLWFMLYLLGFWTVSMLVHLTFFGFVMFLC